MKRILLIRNIVLVFMLTLNVNALAAIGVDSNSSSHCDTCSSLTYSLTIGGGGVNRLLLVGVVVAGGVAEAPPPTVTSVTYAGQGLIQIATYLNIDSQDPGDTHQARVDQWYLIAPATGANNVVISLSGSTYSLLGGATSLTGVNQSTPIRRNAQADAEEVGNATVTINSNANDLVLDTVCAGTSVGTASQSPLYSLNVDSHDACNNIAGSTQAGAGSVTMTWTGMNGGGNDIWVDFASSIEPVPTVAANVGSGAHLGGGKINY